MRIAGLKYNDIVDGIGICVSLWTQGCPFRCPHCHNPQTWDFDGGYETTDLKGTIVKALCANGVKRNFSILGGEPLCEQNRKMVKEVIASVKSAYPDIQIFVWSGYTLAELEMIALKDENVKYIMSNINYLIDGRYDHNLRDVTLRLRGSRNQHIYKYLTKEKNFVKIE